MEYYRYKNNSVEIFPAKIEKKWTATFMINGQANKLIRQASFDTKELATESAKKTAETIIDHRSDVTQCIAQHKIQLKSPNISD